MKRHLRHAGRILLGIALILIGIAGLLLPILPGWAFLIPGMMLLADYFPPFRWLLDWGERMLRDRFWPWMARKHPRIHDKADAFILKVRAEAAPYIRKFLGD